MDPPGRADWDCDLAGKLNPGLPLRPAAIQGFYLFAGDVLSAGADRYVDYPSATCHTAVLP